MEKTSTTKPCAYTDKSRITRLSTFNLKSKRLRELLEDVNKMEPHKSTQYSRYNSLKLKKIEKYISHNESVYKMLVDKNHRLGNLVLDKDGNVIDFKVKQKAHTAWTVYLQNSRGSYEQSSKTYKQLKMESPEIIEELTREAEKNQDDYNRRFNKVEHGVIRRYMGCLEKRNIYIQAILRNKIANIVFKQYKNSFKKAPIPSYPSLLKSKAPRKLTQKKKKNTCKEELISQISTVLQHD